MTILFRYMLREFLKIFLMCFAGLMTIYLVVDFFEKLRRFIRYDADLLTILEFFALRTPFISFQVAPFAVLMATLLALGVLSRNHEITAMRACGISLYRIAAPFVFFGALLTVALLALSAVLIPVATASAEYVKSVKIEKKTRSISFKAERPWIRLTNHTLMNVEVVDPDGATLRSVHLYQVGAQFRLTEITEAKELRYTNRGWYLIDGLQRTLQGDGTLALQPFQSKPMLMSQTPADFRSAAKLESEEMTLPALRAYAERLRREGYNFTRFLTDYYGRVAFPFVSIVMVIVGVALSLRQSGSRTSGMAIGIGQALVIGFLYWATHSVAIALGRTAVLTPMLAGWVTNLLFLSFGCYLFLRVRQ
jgi:lipopolysaccharide export system permease protein